MSEDKDKPKLSVIVADFSKNKSKSEESVVDEIPTPTRQLRMIQEAIEAGQIGELESFVLVYTSILETGIRLTDFVADEESSRADVNLLLDRCKLGLLDTSTLADMGMIED